MADYFEKHGYVVIPNVLTPQVCELIYIQCKMIEEIKCYDNYNCANLFLINSTCNYDDYKLYKTKKKFLKINSYK
jgi:hypothetical protein